MMQGADPIYGGDTERGNGHYSRDRRRGASARASDADRFGDFPPQMAGERTTPQTSNRRDDPQSKELRFADDATRLSPMRSSEVLVLGGSDRRRRESASTNPPREGVRQSNTTEQAPSLDFSMIATPGGKLARVVDADGTYTPSEATNSTTASSVASGGRWTSGTPFGSILRGVVSSTPSMDPRQLLASATPYTAARESLTQQQTPGDNMDGSECTALTFARSAPLSGYLRKLGRNIPTFKRRFFVLKPSTHLYYFLSPHDIEPRGCIDLDMVQENGGGGCEVNEIGTLPDGTFRFELLFHEEASDADGINGVDDNVSESGSRSSQGSKRRHFQRQSIVLEARTEEMGREWMARLQSERLSTARNEVDFLRRELAETRAISARWEKSACEDAKRANEAERQRNASIAEAKRWEEKFTNLNEAIRLLAKRGTVPQGGSSSNFMEEALDGLDVDGTNFEDLSNAFRQMHDDFKLASKREEEGNARVDELEARSMKAEARAAKAEADLARVWEDNHNLQVELKKTKREKKILVREVRSLHVAAKENPTNESGQPQRCDACQNRIDSKQQEAGSTNSIAESRGTTSDTASFAPPKRKLNDEEKRLVIELEEHVMSGLKLSEQFLTLNGIDPSEVGDDLDNSVQASKASLDKSPQRHAPQNALQSLSPQPSTRAVHAPSLPPYMDEPIGSLLDDNDDESEAAVEFAEPNSSLPDNASGGIMPSTASAAKSRQGSDLLNDIYQYSGTTPGGNVSQNLNDRFRKQIAGDANLTDFNESNLQSTLLHREENSADRAPPSLDVASSVSESSRSRVTDNGHATTKLECPLKDVGETPHPIRSRSTLGDDGRVYHLTFYSSKIGLQFQKVPNEAKSTGLLAEAINMDLGPDADTNPTASELRRIASISQHSRSRNNQGGRATEECLPVTPIDAVLVCGFVGFDDSTGNVRPRIGARLVAFDGIPVEVGAWTFESIRKSIQARGRPLTLSFRNDFLTSKQRTILTKAVEDVTPSQSVFRGREHNPDQRGHDHAIYTSTSSVSSQHSQPKSRYYSFSEAGSSISSAVAPLMSNLLSNKKSFSAKKQDDAAPDYMKRTSDSLDRMRHHHDFQSGLL